MDVGYAAHVPEDFEDDHWWMRSRFDWIDRILRPLTRRPRFSVLEIGCGTGNNLRYLRRRYGNRLSELVGVDPSAEPADRDGFRILREPPAGRFDAILLMDVLEHVDRPVELLASLRPHLASGGVLLVTVPAFQWLWTDYDREIHHRKRYSPGALRSELAQAGWSLEGWHFMFGLLFPLFVAQRIAMRRGWVGTRAFKPVHPWLNGVLYWITRVDLAGARWNHGFGSSLAACAGIEGGRS